MSKKGKVSDKSFMIICTVLIAMILLLSIALAFVIRSVRNKPPVTTEKADDPVTVTGTKGTSNSDQIVPNTTTAYIATTTSGQTVPETATQSVSPTTTGQPVPVITTTAEDTKTGAPITDRPETATVTEPIIITSTDTSEEPVVPVVPDVPDVPDDREPASSGSFYSQNDQKLKLYVEWSSKRNESGDSAEMHVKVYIECYSINVGARNKNNITINGKSYTFSTPKINEHFEKKSKIQIADKTYNVDLTDTDIVSLSATWNFKGTYSGVPVENITASDVFAVK